MSESSSGAWRCTLCGYIHRGAEPPEICPICGASKKEFEPYQEAPAPSAPTKPIKKNRYWKCIICGYEEEGANPPEQCPVCGATPKDFQQVTDTAARVTEQPAGIVIVGGGIAGFSAAEAARRVAFGARIVIVSREIQLPYYRLNLTRFLAGEIEEKVLNIKPESWFREHRIEIKTGADVVAIDATGHSVSLSDGSRLPYSKLILATGSHPYVPPIPGIEREGATVLRTVEDALRIRETIRPGLRCAILGGGILGLETAGALAAQGAKASVIEGAPYLMPRQLNERAGRLLETIIAKKNIEVVHANGIDAFEGKKKIEAVRYDGNKTLPTDLVIVCTGVRPNSSLARQANLDVRQGVLVDGQLRTSQSDIYAAGDVAEFQGTVYGIWPAAQYMGTIAGRNAGGESIEFGGIPRSNTLKVLGIDLVSIGQVPIEDAATVEIDEESNGAYTRFLFRDGRMTGAIFLGQADAASKTREAIESRRDFSNVLSVKPGVGNIIEALK
jgi:nitrite reductase (NADH) large subunit